MFLAITSVGWGFNWPSTKFLLSELPPLTLRGATGVIGAVLLAVLALFSFSLRGHIDYARWFKQWEADRKARRDAELAAEARANGEAGDEPKTGPWG